MATEVCIRVQHIYPPIPDRRFDYAATVEGYEPGCPIGYGPTEEEAVADLVSLLEDELDDDAELIAKVLP